MEHHFQVSEPGYGGGVNPFPVLHTEYYTQEHHRPLHVIARGFI